MVVEKKLTQEQKDANWLAFAEHLQDLQNKSKERFEHQISDPDFMRNLKTMQLQPFPKKFYVSTSAEE